MAIQKVNAGFFYPRPPLADSQVLSNVSTFTLDAAGEKVGWVLQATKAGDISGIEFLCQAHTTTGDIDFRVETVSTTADNPSGTLWDTNTNKKQSVSGTGWQTATLTANATVARGDMIAIVLEADATSVPDIAVGGVSGAWEDRRSQPYMLTHTTGWSSSPLEGIVAIKMSDGSYMYTPWTHPASASPTFLTVEADTTPDEVGIKFKVPFPCSVAGLWIHAGKISSGSQIFKLYDSDGSTVLSTITIDEDSLNPTVGNRIYWFDADVSLSADTWYRATFQPDGTSSGTNTIGYWTVNAAANLQGTEGGEDVIMTERTDAGAWTDTDTQRPFMGVILNGFDDAAGGGGSQGISQAIHSIDSGVAA